MKIFSAGTLKVAANSETEKYNYFTFCDLLFFFSKFIGSSVRIRFVHYTCEHTENDESNLFLGVISELLGREVN